MKTALNLPAPIQRLAVGRIYGSSALKVARHFSWVYDSVMALELADLLQERLMDGNERPSSNLWDFSAWSRSALGVGGDFWVCKRLDPSHVFFSLCDVSGKGVSASLVVSMAFGMMRAHPMKGGLRDFLLDLNDAIIQSFHLEKYLTGFFAILDEATMSLELADMGHAHARLFRGGVAHRLSQSRANIPVGIDRDPDPSIARLHLKRGDKLFVYSDGFVEQENERGQEWGERGLSRALLCAMQEGQPFRERLPDCFDEYRGAVPQQDDVSFIDLRVL